MCLGLCHSFCILKMWGMNYLYTEPYKGCGQARWLMGKSTCCFCLRTWVAVLEPMWKVVLWHTQVLWSRCTCTHTNTLHTTHYIILKLKQELYNILAFQLSSPHTPGYANQGILYVGNVNWARWLQALVGRGATSREPGSWPEDSFLALPRSGCTLFSRTQFPAHLRCFRCKQPIA